MATLAPRANSNLDWSSENLSFVTVDLTVGGNIHLVSKFQFISTERFKGYPPEGQSPNPDQCRLLQISSSLVPYLEMAGSSSTEEYSS